MKLELLLPIPVPDPSEIYWAIGTEEKTQDCSHCMKFPSFLSTYKQPICLTLMETVIFETSFDYYHGSLKLVLNFRLCFGNQVFKFSQILLAGLKC